MYILVKIEDLNLLTRSMRSDYSIDRSDLVKKRFNLKDNILSVEHFSDHTTVVLKTVPWNYEEL